MNFPTVFDDAFAFTISPNIEGGYVNDPKDPGGETNSGISDMADGIRDGKYKGIPIKSLTHTQKKEIYFKNYWEAAKCGQYPDPIALLMFDTTVNSWVDTANKILQRALGVTVDGDVGPKTLSTLRRVYNSPGGVDKLISSFCIERLKYLKKLKNWEHNKNGWTTRVRLLQEAAMRQKG